MPAAAKSLGFSSFNSFFACRRCDISFPRISSNSKQPDFSNLDVDNFNQRNKQSNLMYAQQFKNIPTHSARQQFVREHGTRWSEFHRLPYMDAVKSSVFDPMHSVWIGTCKRIVTHIFLKHLTNQHLNEMADMCKKILLPFGYDSSSLARKINLGNGFSYMKADEWRVFTVALSPLLLKGRLDTPYYNNWMIFVKCMQVMSLPAISRQDIQRCHDMIKEFSAGFLQLYGKEEIMSNQHYHFHLKVKKKKWIIQYITLVFINRIKLFYYLL